MITTQKALNNAFHASLVVFCIGVLALISSRTINPLGIIEVTLFPIFGYFTKKGKKEAAIALLILFIIDRLIFIIYGLPILNSQRSFNIISIVLPVFYTLTLWNFFYVGYLAAKSLDKK